MVSKRIRRLIEVTNAFCVGDISEETFNDWYFIFKNPYWMGKGALYEAFRKANKCVGW